MSLLLDARKKSQQAQGGAGLELSLDDYSVSSPTLPDSKPVEQARSAGQNLFNAKTQTPSTARASISRNLLIALAGAILLLAVGGGYVWYAISPPPPQALRAMPPPVAPNNLVPNIPPAQVVAEAKPAEATVPASSPAPRKSRARSKPALLIEQHQTEPIDPILNAAYRAYRAGKFAEAQQLYKNALALDGRNTDALLGLAAIAQRQGADIIAAHYYSQVLELDPRDAVANAGMSALTTGNNSESRLKTLIHEQQDSSALHFALGNRFAAESRWGEAQQEFFNAYKLETGNAELAFNLAVSLDRLGQNKLAAQYYQRALELDSAGGVGIDHAKISQRIEELNR